MNLSQSLLSEHMSPICPVCLVSDDGATFIQRSICMMTLETSSSTLSVPTAPPAGNQ
jgi:hypothetical protein